MFRSTLRNCIPIATVALLLALESPASAQYFGRNKVQFKDLDFQVLKTEHFDIYFYPEEREGIDIAARMSERWLARLERLFAHQLRGRQPLVLYASHPDFEQTNAIQGELGEGTGGVTEPLRRRIVLPLGGPLADTDHVIGHELVHAFQFDMTTGPNSAPGQNGAERLPLWFIEGMAEYLSLGPVDPNTAMWLRDAARPATEGKSVGSVTIRGTEGMAVQLATCCRPIPGDAIVGSIKKGQGLVVHVSDCSHIVRSRKNEPDQWIDVEWDPRITRLFQAAINVMVENQRGVLAKVASEIADAGSNIDSITMEDDRTVFTTMHFVLEVKNRQHLARVMRSLRRLSDVKKIARVRE